MKTSDYKQYKKTKVEDFISKFDVQNDYNDSDLDELYQEVIDEMEGKEKESDHDYGAEVDGQDEEVYEDSYEI
jgi:hypothetical protein